MRYEAVFLGNFRFLLYKGEEMLFKKMPEITIAQAKAFFLPKSTDTDAFYFPMKTYVVVFIRSASPIEKTYEYVVVFIRSASPMVKTWYSCLSDGENISCGIH